MGTYYYRLEVTLSISIYTYKDSGDVSDVQLINLLVPISTSWILDKAEKTIDHMSFN